MGQMSFSYHLLIVVSPSFRVSVRPSVNFFFDFFSKTSGPNLSKHGSKHYYEIKGENDNTMKIGCVTYKITFSRTTAPEMLIVKTMILDSNLSKFV